MDTHLQGQCERHALLTGIACVMHYRGHDTMAAIGRIACVMHYRGHDTMTAIGSQLKGSRLL